MHTNAESTLNIPGYSDHIKHDALPYGGRDHIATVIFTATLASEKHSFTHYNECLSNCNKSVRPSCLVSEWLIKSIGNSSIKLTEHSRMGVLFQ